MAKNFIEDIAFGAQGSTYADSSSSAITPPTNNVYVAIYMLTDTVFTNTGLVAESATGSINTEGIGAGANGKVVDSVIFTAGTIIYGRWTSIDMTSGSVIAYVGN